MILSTKEGCRYFGYFANRVKESEKKWAKVLCQFKSDRINGLILWNLLTINSNYNIMLEHQYSKEPGIWLLKSLK